MLADRVRMGVQSGVDLPGPPSLIAGNMDAGFFGEVPVSELWNGSQLANELGVIQGTLIHENEAWLKFATDGKVIYKSKKPYRTSISWDYLHSLNVVNGERMIEKNGVTYGVRLMRGTTANPFTNSGNRSAPNSEWNKLMLPIHEKAETQSWLRPAYVTETTEYWGIDYTDKDLHTMSNYGNGSYHLCQEMSTDGKMMVRGYIDVSNAWGQTPSSSDRMYGWSPVLEVIK